MTREGNRCGPGGKYWQPIAGFMAVTCRLTAKKPVSALSPTLVIEYGTSTDRLLTNCRLLGLL